MTSQKNFSVSLQAQLLYRCAGTKVVSSGTSVNNGFKYSKKKKRKQKGTYFDLNISCLFIDCYFFNSEWELRYKNGSWEEAMDCQYVPHTECDLTSDLASDSDYNVRVRAECNGQDSEWTTLSTPFNRRNSKALSSATVSRTHMSSSYVL